MFLGYDIIVLAGQSNASGRGKGAVDVPYEKDEKIEMIYDPQPCPFKKDEKGNDYLEVIKPFNFIRTIASELIENGESLGNFALYFCKEYIKNNLLDKDRKLLIVNTATGGTGFTKHHWGKGEVLNERMFEMIDYALSLKGNNKIVSLLWHQGEHDAFEGVESGKSSDEIYEFYLKNLKELVDSFLCKYGEIPFIAGEFCSEWSNKNKPQCDAVINATKYVVEHLKKGKVVSSNNLFSNNQKINNGDDIHFCRQSLMYLGQRYFNAFNMLNNRK